MAAWEGDVFHSDATFLEAMIGERSAKKIFALKNGLMLMERRPNRTGYAGGSSCLEGDARVGAMGGDSGSSRTFPVSFINSKRIPMAASKYGSTISS